MSEERFIKTINILLFIAGVFLFYGLTYYITDRTIPEATEEEKQKDMFTSKDFGTAPTEAWWTEDTRIEMSEVEEKWIAPVVTYKEMELTSLGTYYITAYCPSEPVTEDEYRALKKMGVLEFFIERKEQEYEFT